MLVRIHCSILIAILCCCLPPARSLAGPADFWLDRAAAELGKVADEPWREPLTEKGMMLEMLLIFRGSPADRELMLAYAARLEKHPTESPMDRFGWLYATAYHRALAGDLDGAKKLLPPLAEAARQAKEPRKGEQPFLAENKGWMIDSQMTTLYALCGDRERGKEADLRRAVELLARHGRRVEAEQWLREAEARMGPPIARDAEKNVEGNERAWRSICEAYAEFGDLASARRVAAALPPENYHRAEALCGVAREYIRSGDQEGYRACLDDAIRGCKGATGTDRQMAAWAVLDVARNAQDAASFDRGVKLYEEAAQWMQHDPLAFLNAAKIAAGFAAVGNQDTAARWIAKGEAGLNAIDTPQRRAEVLLALAGAYARTGNAPKTAELVRQSQAAFKLESWASAEWYQMIVANFAEAGEFAAAIAQADDGLRPDDREFARFDVAKQLAARGRYDEALTLVKDAKWLDGKLRLRGIRAIVMARARAGETTTLAAWIDNLDDARERAAFNLAAAEQTLGRAGRGLMRMVRY